MKGKKLLLAKLIEYSGIGAIIRTLRPPQLAIYNFHRVRSKDSEVIPFDDLIYGISEENFEAILISLKKWADPIGEIELLQHVQKIKTINKNCFAVTFDDGYVDFYTRAWPILKKHNIPAFLFVPTEAIEQRKLGWWDRIAYIIKNSPIKNWSWDGRTYNLATEGAQLNWILHRAYGQGNSFLRNDDLQRFAEELKVDSIPRDLQSKELLSWQQIKELYKEGVAIGAHSHRHEVFSNLTIEEQRADLITCKEIISKQLGFVPQSLAWPVGGYIHYTDESVKIAEALDFPMMFSYETGTNVIAKLDCKNIKRVSGDTHPIVVKAELALPNLFSTYQSKESSHWPLTISAALISMINFLVPVLMARLLLPNDVGIFRIFSLYLSVFPALTLIMGLNNGLSLWGGQGDKGRNIIQSVGFFLLIYSVFLFLLLIFFQGFITEFFHISMSLFVAMAFTICFFAASGFYELASVASGTIVSTAFISLGFEFLKSLAIGIALYFWRRLDLVLWVFAGWTAFKLILTNFWSWKIGLIKFELDLPRLKEAKNYALPVSLAAVFSFLVNYSDKFLLTYFLLPADYAFYSIGCLSIPPLIAFEISVHSVLIPKLAKMFDLQNHKEGRIAAQKLYRKSISDLAFLLFPAAVGLFIFAEPIVTLIFSDKYLESSSYLRFYSLSYVILCFPIDSIARAKGESRWIFKNSVFVGISALIMILIGVTLFKAKGALIGYLLGQLLFRVQAYRYLRNSDQWTFKEIFPVPALLSMTLLSLFLGIVSYFCEPFFADKYLWFFVNGGLFAIIYLFFEKKMERLLLSKIG